MSNASNTSNASNARGQFVWFELVTDDVEAGLSHYEKVLGWTRRAMPMGDFDYQMIGRGELGHCGVVKPQGADAAGHWTSYIAVDDVDATVARVEGAGGEVRVPATDLPGVGRFALIADPEGATLHVFRPAGEGNASSGFHWNELWCHDPEQTLRFYAQVLGAEIVTMDMPMGKYYLLRFGDRATGGAFRSPVADLPAHWLPYALVEDVDAAVGRARSDGGALLGEVQTVEEVGRFAVLASPDGARLGVMVPGA